MARSIATSAGEKPCYVVFLPIARKKPDPRRRCGPALPPLQPLWQGSGSRRALFAGVAQGKLMRYRIGLHRPGSAAAAFLSGRCEQPLSGPVFFM
jgi:hypothetical protein